MFPRAEELIEASATYNPARDSFISVKAPLLSDGFTPEDEQQVKTRARVRLRVR